MPRPGVSIREIRDKNGVISNRTPVMRSLRRVGVYVSYGCLKLGMRPVHLTYFNFALGMGICALFATGGQQGRYVAASLMVLWEICDTADGGMARALGQKSNYGGFVDHTGGMFLVAFLHLSIAVGLGLRPERWSSTVALLGRHPEFLVVSAAFSAVASLLYRLILQIAEIRFQRKVSDDQSLAKSPFSALFLFLKDLDNFGGYQILLLVLCAWLNALTLFVVAYAALEGILLVGVVGRLLWEYRNAHEYPATPRTFAGNH